MKQCTTSYTLIKGDFEISFDSERAACEYLGVSYCTVASCFRRNSKCKGFDIKKNGITTHGATKTRLFKIWSSMHERCERTRHIHFNSYGGRGIKVCSEWSEFVPFQQWALNSGYSDALTIDRIDVNKNYSPDNCRWTTIKEQAKNKRTNHFVIVNGQKMTLSECSEKYSIPKSTLRYRENNHKDLISGVRKDDGG